MQRTVGTAQRTLLRGNVQVESCPSEKFGGVRKLVEGPLRRESPMISVWLSIHQDEFCGRTRPVWIAPPNGKIKGALAARFNGRKDAKVSFLFIDEKHRSKGLGAALLEAFEAHAQERGCEQAHLNVYADNKGAIRFWNSHGYDVMGSFYHRDENKERLRLKMIKRF